MIYRSALFSTCAITALLVLTPAYAATYYVAPSGNDSNAGSQTAPWKTLSKADASVAPGDTVRVAPGTYVGVKTVKNGTSSARITYVSDTPWGAKINSAPSSGDIIWWSAGDYTDILGFEIDGTSTLVEVNGGILLSGTGSTAKNNRVHHVATGGCNPNGASGIGTTDFYSGGTGLTVSANYVHDIGLVSCGSGGSWLWQGIYAASPHAGSDTTTGTLVENNVVANVVAGFAAHVWHNGRRVKFYNNTFVNNAGCFLFGGGDYYNGFTATGSGGNIAANNICSGAQTGFNQSGDNQVANIYTNNLEFGITNRTTGTMQVSYLQNAVIGDPKFVSATDRHLQSTSLAIGAALATYLPAKDFDGVTCPIGGTGDLGAYEIPSPPSGGSPTPLLYRKEE